MLKKLNEFGERGGIIRKILAFVASLIRKMPVAALIFMRGFFQIRRSKG